MESTLVLPSPPVPDMTIASGAGLSCDENHTRRSRSNQKTSGTGRDQGMRMLISTSGTLAGMGAMSPGGVPYTVARSAAESAKPVGGPDAAGDTKTSSASPCANAAWFANAAVGTARPAAAMMQTILLTRPL